MLRRLYILNGLGIFGVVCNHAGFIGISALFWTVDRFSKIPIYPTFEQIGSWSYYFLLVMRQLAVFCVPAFLFSTGYFVAYAARGNQSQLTWKVTIRRTVNILIPYMLWSLIWFAFDFWGGSVYTLPEYAKRLILGAANNTYFYVIVVVQLYLLSPFLVPFIKKFWKISLVGATVILLLSLGLRYENTFGVEVVSPIRYLFSLWFISNWLVYFVLGVVVSFHQTEFTRWILKYKWWLLAATVMMGALSILEADLGFRFIKADWIGPHTVSSVFYVTAFVLSFLAFQDFKVPFTKFFTTLGHDIYGIYLTHWIILEITALFLLANAPFVFSNQIILQAILILVGIAIPIAMMKLTLKTPMRRYYRYMFG